MSKPRTFMSSFWDFIRPESQEIAAYALIMTAIFGFAIFQVVINGQSDVGSESVSELIQQLSGKATALLSQGEGWARFFLFGFWFIVGGVAYTLAWSVATAIKDIREDIEVSSEFIHPRSFSQSGFWKSIILRMVIRVSAAIALIFYGVYWLFSIAAMSIALTKRLIGEPISIANILGVIFAASLMFVTLHIGALLLRLVLLRTASPE